MKSEMNYELLLSSISHELRNPVTLIQSYLQLMGAAHPEVCRYEHWDTIWEELRHLRRLLEDLSAFNNGLRIRRQELDFGMWLTDYAKKAAAFLGCISKKENPYMPFEHKYRPIERASYNSYDNREFFAVAEAPAYDFIPQEKTASASAFIPGFSNSLASPAHQEVFPEFSENSRIRFSCRIAPNLPSLSADPDKLQQALDNLIRNAAEAHSSQISLFAYREQNQVILEVSDNGDGISQEYLPNLFTPFVSHKPEGTGLGLAITERIIKAHRGTITVHSEPHHLTVFQISLPIQIV